jgi:signal transduction histidine kinase
MSVGRSAFDALLDALAEVVLFTDADGTLTFVNARGVESLGLDKHVGARLADRLDSLALVGVDGRPLSRAEHPVLRTLDTGQPTTGVRLGVVAADGEQRWYTMNTVPLRQGERLVGTASVLHDVTVASRLEAALADHAARLEAIVNLVSDGVFVIGADGRLLYANAVGEALLGLPLHVDAAERAARLGVATVDGRTVHPENFPSARALAGATVTGVEYVVRGADDAPRHVVTGAHPLRRPDGTIYAALVTMREVTEEVRVRAELEAAREAAEEANRLKDQFIAALSHELRAPLQPILGWAEVLRRHGTLDAVTQQALDVIRRNIRQQVRLVDDLLDLSRIGHGKLALRMERFDLREQVRAALEPFEEAATQKRVRLSITLPPEPLLMWGDGARLHQVVTNLVSNAVKFTAAGGQVAVTLIAAPDEAWLEVEDTGEGIAGEDLAVIFEPFRQGGAGRRGGLGLGLSLVRQLTEMHGGSVEAASEGPGYGARFRVRLPRAAVPTPPAVAPLPGGRRLDRVDILVVEDNADTREVLRYMLEVEGARVETAETGQDAVETAVRRAPRIVLCDVGLPDIDGLEVARRLRRQAGLEGIRLIALTGYGQAEDVRQAMEAGFDAHLTKPINFDQLLALLAPLTAPLTG